MRVHVLQHAPFEGLGSIERWLARRRAQVATTRLYESSARFPEVASFDFLVALGGPMSVNDEASHPWLAPEKRFIADAVRSGKRVLGICLGAQLLANALGAAVRSGAHKEIGWFDIRAERQPPGALQLPEEESVFHWHGQMFDIPDGAVRLAESAGCKNQAFQLGAHVVGLQFHLEMTPRSVEAMIASCGSELADPGLYVQSADVLRRAGPRRFARAQELMGGVLDQLTRGCA
ncbi:MAG TPA: type 1 glutamine amidotransferase [Myxococcota bacterium]|nr:type 1 glutamine amidotransferase [Myxococcota bacterium]